MGFQEQLDPNGSKRRQFERTVELVAERPRPKGDYRSMNDTDFLAIDFLGRILEIQTSYMLLLRSFAALRQRGYIAEPVAQKGYLSFAEIVAWNHEVQPKELYEAYCSYPDRLLIGLLVDLKLERFFLDDEFAKRLSDKPFTTEMLLIDCGLDREKELNRVIRTKSIWARKQSADDIRDLLGAVGELWCEPSSKNISDEEIITPLPKFPGAPHIKMLHPEKEFWEGPITKIWQDGKRAFVRKTVPLLAGEKEDISEKARLQQRNEWQTIARQRKIVEKWRPDIELELYNNPADALEGPDLELSLDIKRQKEKEQEQLNRRIEILEKKTPRLSRSKVRQVVEMYRKGVSARQIAKTLVIDKNTVNKWIKELKLSPLRAV
jgi:hypothetical protein